MVLYLIRMILHYFRGALEAGALETQTAIAREMPVADLMSSLPPDVSCFWVTQSSGDPEVPDGLVLPRHFVLRGDRLGTRVTPINRQVRIGAGAGGKAPTPFSNLSDATHFLPFVPNDELVPGMNAPRRGGSFLLPSERIVRVPQDGWYVLEELDGTVVEEGPYCPPAD